MLRGTSLLVPCKILFVNMANTTWMSSVELEKEVGHQTPPKSDGTLSDMSANCR